MNLRSSSGIRTIVPGRIVLLMFAILPMDLKRAMAINVRRERHARDWSQEELADRARLSARYLGSIERADNSWRASAIALSIRL
jgi:predicted transcriptional regulator